MARILLLAAVAPSELALNAVVPEWKKAGHTVELAAVKAFNAAVPPSLSIIHCRVSTHRPLLRRPGSSPGRMDRLRHFSSRILDKLLWRKFGSRLVAKQGLAVQLWFFASRDQQFRRRAGAADVVVALDRNAIYAAWRLGRRLNTKAAVLYGLEAARLQLEKVS